jgi:hypothetical protein
MQAKPSIVHPYEMIGLNTKKNDDDNNIANIYGTVTTGK